MLKNNELDYGEVIQIIGPVVDVRFKELHLPNLLTALEIKREDGTSLTVEVAQHIGDDVVRCIAMGPTEEILSNKELMEANGLELPLCKQRR